MILDETCQIHAHCTVNNKGEITKSLLMSHMKNYRLLVPNVVRNKGYGIAIVIELYESYFFFILQNLAKFEGYPLEI